MAEQVRCQRIGCDATFSPDNNPDGSCRFHDSGPIFHDGMKKWSCCKRKSHDFSDFLAIPGCKAGQHTTEKPVFAPAPIPVKGNTTVPSSKESCSRCKQGFFCSDHGSNPNPKPVETQLNTATSEETVVINAPPKKIVSITEPQTCKNKGCGQTFKEIDNHEHACNYHPGPPVFHDRLRGLRYLIYLISVLIS